jgi:pimeloyl-ACP methyl ester carboxylesterase
MAGVLMLCGQLVAGADSGPMSRSVDIDGVTIHYLESGAVTARETLLLVPGWCGGAEDFRPLMTALPEGYRCLSIDLPGHGLSSKPDAPYDMEYYVGFLRSFCLRMGLSDFVFVGHSMGGQFAVHYASRWPGTIRRLVLIDPYGLPGEEGGFGLLASLGPLVDLGFALNNRLFIEWGIAANVLYRPAAATLRAVADSTAVGILGQAGARAAARTTRAVVGHDTVEGILPSLTLPTLVLWGDHDRFLSPSWAERFLALLPSARLVIIPDAGHMPMTERPSLTAIALAGFLAEPEANPAADPAP